MLDAIRKPVAEELQRFNRLVEERFESGDGLIASILTYVLEQKGKQMRPLLVLLTAGLNGKVGDLALTGAMLAEMAHTSSLIHDDVVDEAHMRRGQLSVNAVWRSKTAVLAGDYLLAQAMDTSLRDGGEKLLPPIIEAFRELAEGELIQLEHASRLDMTEALYYEIIRKKTASLLGACGAMGAIAAEAGSAAEEDMRTFGTCIGMAFQIRDDMLDYEGARTGKPECEDLRERKVTLPLLYLLDRAEPAERKQLIRLLCRAEEDEAAVTALRERVLRGGGMDHAEQAMAGFRDKALAVLERYPDSPYRESLRLYCRYILERDR